MRARFQCYTREGRVHWRLLGSNNRALARCAEPFATLQEATADAEAVAALAQEAVIDLVSTTGSQWRWVLRVDGRDRAVAGAPYARRLECVRAVTRFRVCAPAATVVAEPLVTRTGSTGRPRRTPADTLERVTELDALRLARVPTTTPNTVTGLRDPAGPSGISSTPR